MTEIFQEIYQSLKKGIALVVATIVSDSGSTPRTSGAKMIVLEDGQIFGTIGGGAVEGDVARKALHLFSAKGGAILSYNLNHNNMTEMDLICGGRMQVLLEYVPVSSENIKMYRTVCDQMGLLKSCLWLGKLSIEGDQVVVGRALATAQKTLIGSFQVSDEHLKIFDKGGIDTAKTSLVEVGEQRYVVERILPPDTIYLVGGGHVSKEIASLTKQVGFRTVVIDDRAEFANTDRFRDVDGVKVSPGFADVFADFMINTNSYIIIVTRGHSFDKDVLVQALRTEAGYIGMIGSRRKRQSIYQQLLQEGFEQSLIDQVHCPIGLPIDAETPAEIGISVVAQLIQHRAGQKGRG